MLHMSIYTFSE